MQVVSEYRKARAIMADVTSTGAAEDTAGGPKGIWSSIFLEVDKVHFLGCSLPRLSMYMNQHG